MAQSLQSLFKLLKTHPKRFKRTEKELFLKEIEQLFSDWGYSYQRKEKQGKIWKSINLTTKVRDPKFIIMAHYDTPTMLPPWVEIFVRIFGHTRPVFLSLAIFLMLFLLIIIPGKIAAILAIAIGLSFLFLLIPNPKNLNDNSSGVLGLLALAQQLKDDKKAQKNVQFVLLDNEEFILTGAEHLRDIWEDEETSFEDARIISLDCIGWGSRPIIIRNGASYVGNELIDIFQEERSDAQLINMGLIPLNDNYVFRDAGAVLVAFMDEAKWKNGFYIKNIHSFFDRKIDLNNIKWIVDNLLEYMKREKAIKKQ